MDLLDAQSFADRVGGSESVARGHDQSQAGVAQRLQRLGCAGLDRVGNGHHADQSAISRKVDHAGTFRTQRFRSGDQRRNVDALLRHECCIPQNESNTIDAPAYANSCLR